MINQDLSNKINTFHGTLRKLHAILKSLEKSMRDIVQSKLILMNYTMLIKVISYLSLNL